MLFFVTKVGLRLVLGFGGFRLFIFYLQGVGGGRVEGIEGFGSQYRIFLIYFVGEGAKEQVNVFFLEFSLRRGFVFFLFEFFRSRLGIQDYIAGIVGWMCVARDIGGFFLMRKKQQMFRGMWEVGQRDFCSFRFLIFNCDFFSREKVYYFLSSVGSVVGEVVVVFFLFMERQVVGCERGEIFCIGLCDFDCVILRKLFIFRELRYFYLLGDCEGWNQCGVWGVG